MKSNHQTAGTFDLERDHRPGARRRRPKMLIAGYGPDGGGAGRTIAQVLADVGELDGKGSRWWAADPLLTDGVVSYFADDTPDVDHVAAANPWGGWSA